MVVLNRIYTRTGDDGTTALGSGDRRKKYDLRVDAYGTLDEVNAAFEHAEHHSGSPGEHAKTYRDKVVPGIVKLRETVDALETMVDDALWPLPKYREMLFMQ